MRKYVTVAVIPALVIICLLLILLPGQVPLDTKEKPESLPVAAGRTEAEEPAGAAPEEGTTERPPQPSDSAEAGTTDEGDSVACGIISGRITRSDGNPAGGAKVVAAGFAGNGDATADENGVYRVDGLRPGSYTVAASLPGFARDFKPGVAVVSMRETGGIDFSLLRGGTIEGALFDTSGNGVSGEVCLSEVRAGEEWASGYSYRDSTQAGGQFKIEAIMPGRYSLEVFAPGYLGTEKKIVDIFDGETARIEISLEKGGWISGMVLNERNEPVRDAEVSASGTGRVLSNASAMTDEAGNFTLTGLPDGSYLVQAMHNDYRRSEPVTIPVTAGRGVEAVKIVLVMDKEGVISGRVVSEGEPVEGAKIEVISKNLSDSKITDSEGKFSFRGLEEGVNMTVKAQGYHERAFIGVRPGTVEMVIEVRRRGLPVTGKVRLDRLKAVSHVTVHVYQIMRDTGKERLTGVYPFFEKFPEFAFSVELLEGEYRLEFSTEGYEGVDRSVIVTDAPVEFSLKLKPLP